ncbi:MAG: hypothetical protein ACI9AV_001157 [Sediminicola sp.]|jgi:hypothetical protein
MNFATKKITGTHMLDAPAEFGEIYSQNIPKIKHMESGIG